MFSSSASNSHINASSDRQHTQPVINGALHSSRQDQQHQDKAETASVRSYDSTSALLKSNDDSKANEKAGIDAQKLQKQALKSQIRFNM
ncbi:hypothetical protein G7046_g5415 [Stylonectria norvegica]|nr:hypothetical protein G7046_g5415 [Stylonectria norvegica]